MAKLNKPISITPVSQRWADHVEIQAPVSIVSSTDYKSGLSVYTDAKGGKWTRRSDGVWHSYQSAASVRKRGRRDVETAYEKVPHGFLDIAKKTDQLRRYTKLWHRVKESRPRDLDAAKEQAELLREMLKLLE